MKIHRDNYEEYLLLYVDGVLTPAEKAAVEAYVAQHADVAIELRFLQASLLDPQADACTMPGKCSLYRLSEWDADAISAEQQQLLLLSDGELEPAAAQQMLDDLKTNTLLQKEWEMLQASRMVADVPEAMPGKEKLYRTKARVVRMVGFYRAMAAAVLAGLGWFLFNNPGMMGPSEARLAVVQGPGKADSLSPDHPQPSGTDGQLAKETPIVMPPSKTVTVHKTELVAGEASPVNQSPTERTIAGDAKNASVSMTTASGQPVAQQSVEIPQKQPLVALQTEKINMTPAPATIDIGSIDTNPAGHTSLVANMEEMSPALALLPVTYREDQAGNEYDDVIYIAGARISKQKVRNVVRTVGRTVGRTFERSRVIQADTGQPL